jgi:hypothetical protein
VKTTRPNLTCPCGAAVRNTSKERGRFTRRHLIPAAKDLDLHVAVQKLRRDFLKNLEAKNNG